MEERLETASFLTLSWGSSPIDKNSRPTNCSQRSFPNKGAIWLNSYYHYKWSKNIQNLLWQQSFCSLHSRHHGPCLAQWSTSAFLCHLRSEFRRFWPGLDRILLWSDYIIQNSKVVYVVIGRIHELWDGRHQYIEYLFISFLAILHKFITRLKYKLSLFAKTRLSVTSVTTKHALFHPYHCSNTSQHSYKPSLPQMQ